MNEHLSQLYHPLILRHNDAPVRFEKRPQAQHIIDAYNPLCGDKFKIFLDTDAQGVITDASFHGYGCAVSKASTSVLVETLQGIPLSMAREKIAQFLKIVTTDAASDDATLSAFAAARHFPGREKCATLSWVAVQEFVEQGA